MLVQFAISEIFYRSMPLNAADVREMITQGKFAWGQFALFSLMSAFLWLWIVVGWHRYILLNERPRLVPAFRFGRMLGYFGKSLLIALILAPLGLILGFIAGGIVSATALGSSNLIVILIVMGLVVYLPVSTVGMRLVSMLPGAARQSDVPVFSGWEATRGATTTILGVVILSGFFAIALDFLGSWIFASSTSLPATIFELAKQWVVAMIGASILTTLYGHYIEKRPLA